MHRSRRKNQLIPLQISSSLIGQNKENTSTSARTANRRHHTFAYTSRVAAADDFHVAAATTFAYTLI
jgi:hypothetical protein